MSDTIQKIVDCCRRIVEADPKTDQHAEDELYKIGEALYGLGYEDTMREACQAAVDLSVKTHGRTWGIASLCNTVWHGIGTWER